MQHLAHLGSLRELLAWLLAGLMAAGWLADGWLAAGWQVKCHSVAGYSNQIEIRHRNTGHKYRNTGRQERNTRQKYRTEA